ncbi:UNVERIFIED_CONTAM: hypothetical protein PYX00_009733 [Menopon gallinae]|uniref:Rab3 GTPase-activating protein non-catalytic subunit n=1 Tax=Menopon gallinae TaxID=328185 RepID=A0AAW2HCS5_9NEOP
MSCEIKHIARFVGINNCKQSFLGKGIRKDENWLQECIVSLSPTGEILVLAKGTYVYIFASKWVYTDSGDMRMEFEEMWKGQPCTKSGDITSVLCLPLVSLRQSANGADWTCIVVGYSSGTIKFFTEKMYQLLSEVLHAEPIIQIKCNSFRSGSQRGSGSATDQEPHDTIYVLYKTVICVLNGFSLIQTLRGCRSRLARQSATLTSMSLDGFPIDFKKYGFSDQDAITDASFVGQTSINIFDHLVTASLAAGFKCYYRPSPPQTSLIVATGRKPFLGFHYTVESGDKWGNLRGGAVLAGVAMAVGSKIKDSVAASLPGWFAFGSSEQDKMKVSQEPAEQLRCRFGLCDLWRHGSSIITSPDGRLSAITDSLGRIFLIENNTGIARRLWKGYREAQCGFLEVEEDVEKSRHKRSKSTLSSSNGAVPRRVLFIIIYAPKKGLIEVFGVQQGPCVASFKVSKHGQLLYTPYGLLGFNNAPTKGANTGQYTVSFICEDGIREIIVPFHCGLRSDNSNKARDLHILKKIKAYLKEGHSDASKVEDDVEAFAKDMKTEEIKTQVVEMLMTNKQITARAFMKVLNVFIGTFTTEEQRSMSSSFVALVESLENLIAFYIFLKDLNNQPPNYKTVVGSEENESQLADTLLLTSKEMSSVTKLIKMVNEMENKVKGDSKVTFAEGSEKSLTQFISCFNVNGYVNSVVKEEKQEGCSLYLKADLNDEKLKWIGEFLFSGIFYSEDWINDWKTYVSESKLATIDMMKCLLSYWSNKSVTDNLNFEIVSLVELIKAVCSLMDPEEITIEYNKQSPWWIAVRSYLKKSQCSISALLAAIACRAVTITIEQMKEIRQAQSGKKQNQESEESQNNGWENVSKDTWEWDILISNLEDLTLLNSVLNLPFQNYHSTRPKLDFNFDEISIKSVLYKGDGYITELVAKWLVQFGLEPSCLIDRKDVEFLVKTTTADEKNSESEAVVKKESSEIEEAKALGENETVHLILHYVGVLKEKFPYSLTSSALLANICWEYMAYWYKNPEELSCLESAVEFLKAVPSTDIQHGLSYLCWTMHMSNRFGEVMRLINKAGKVPREKLCFQDVQLTNIQVLVFLKFSTEMLYIMLETGTSEKKTFIYNQEGIWQNEPIGNCQSLVNLALSQPKVNEELLLLHYQLSLCLHMMAELNIKFPKMFSTLFDCAAWTNFLTDLCEKSQVSCHSSSASLTKARTQFLYKVIAGAVQTIDVVESIPPFPVRESPDYVPETKENVEKATKWLSHCIELARLWNIPVDDLRRNYVCELYSCGFDRLAEEILPAVNECEALASQLLLVAGQRLKIYIHGSSSLSEKMSNLSPNLSTWLQSLDESKLKNHNIDLNDLRTVLSYVLKCRPSTAEEERLAVEMTESIPPMDNEGSLSY